MDRSHNKVADGLADLTMDTRRSWERDFATTLHLDRCNIVVQTDGGLRDGDCAAAAYVIGLWDGAVYEPLYACGIFLDVACTVFTAEAIALDEATKKMCTLL